MEGRTQQTVYWTYKSGQQPCVWLSLYDISYPLTAAEEILHQINYLSTKLPHENRLSIYHDSLETEAAIIQEKMPFRHEASAMQFMISGRLSL